MPRNAHGGRVFHSDDDAPNMAAYTRVIIEHPTRGTYNDRETETGRPSFSVVGSRRDAPTFVVGRARQIINGFPANIARDCKMRESHSSMWEVVA